MTFTRPWAPVDALRGQKCDSPKAKICTLHIRNASPFLGWPRHEIKHTRALRTGQQLLVTTFGQFGPITESVVGKKVPRTAKRRKVQSGEKVSRDNTMAVVRASR